MRQAKAQVVEPALEIGFAAGAGVHGNPRRLVDYQNKAVATEQSFLGVSRAGWKRALPVSRPPPGEAKIDPETPASPVSAQDPTFQIALAGDLSV